MYKGYHHKARQLPGHDDDDESSWQRSNARTRRCSWQHTSDIVECGLLSVSCCSRTSALCLYQYYGVPYFFCDMFVSLSRCSLSSAHCFIIITVFPFCCTIYSSIVVLPVSILLLYHTFGIPVHQHSLCYCVATVELFIL